MKHCPPDKIINPRTQRCIKRDGRLAKTLTVNKDCPPNKIRNPRTKRCIKRDGRLAKTLKKRDAISRTRSSRSSPRRSYLRGVSGSSQRDGSYGEFMRMMDSMERNDRLAGRSESDSPQQYSSRDRELMRGAGGGFKSEY